MVSSQSSVIDLHSTTFIRFGLVNRKKGEGESKCVRTTSYVLAAMKTVDRRPRMNRVASAMVRLVLNPNKVPKIILLTRPITSTVLRPILSAKYLQGNPYCT